MDPKWIGVLVFVAFMLLLVNSAVSGLNLSENGTYVDPTQEVTTYEQAWTQTDFGKLTSPKFSSDYFQSLTQLLKMDSPVWDTGPLALVKMLVVTVISGIIIFGIGALFLSIFRSLL